MAVHDLFDNDDGSGLGMELDDFVDGCSYQDDDMFGIVETAGLYDDCMDTDY